MKILQSIIIGIVVSFTAWSQIERKPVEEEVYLYQSVPDITLNTGNATIKMSSLWNEKPVLLTFVYAECNGVCVPYLKSFNSAITKIGGSGEDYYTVILSFDTTDNRNKMYAMSAMAGLNKKSNYLLATSSSEDLQKILKATGFWYRPIGDSNQFDHPTEIVAIKEGKIQRILQGNEVSVPRLYEVMEESLGYFVRSYPLMADNLLFTCFKVDPATGQTKLSWGAIFLVLPGVATVLAAVTIFSRRSKPS